MTNISSTPPPPQLPYNKSLPSVTPGANCDTLRNKFTGPDTLMKISIFFKTWQKGLVFLPQSPAKAWIIQGFQQFTVLVGFFLAVCGH